jgi:hypothetical protein
VLRIDAKNAYYALALDDLALIAHFFYTSSNFHLPNRPSDASFRWARSCAQAWLCLAAGLAQDGIIPRAASFSPLLGLPFPIFYGIRLNALLKWCAFLYTGDGPSRHGNIKSVKRFGKSHADGPYY